MMINKVLLATMSLDIGGAETHIVELALELKRRGIDVSVASSGGVYVDALTDAGVTHHIVPMNRRTPSDMLKSYLLLGRIIKREKPEIVHAHARIPAFICGVLHKTMRFKFITTAHWVFDVGHGLRYLTNWGQKTIAVSDDIKQYLIDNYGISSDNIFVTMNGIDTDKFSPEISSNSIINEFGLDRDRPIICNVSRLDERAAVVSRQLVELVPELNERLPGVQLLIAGDGDIYDELRSKANSINGATGINTVTLTGARTDINQILAACDLFVGVSRAALEAMATEKPVIVAGSEGFIGLFTPEKLKIAIDTNFCCRGCAESTNERLLREITDFFIETRGERIAELTAFGRAVVVENYSVRRMVDDCVKAYDSMSNRGYRVVMSGYYGFKNTGDEAILQSIYRNIKEACEDISITVLSYDPEDTKTRYGYDAVDRFKLLRVIKSLWSADALVFGGGSLLQDLTSTRSLMYYLFIISAAKFMGKKVMIYANGIGPVQKKANRRRVRRVVSRADVITLRDEASAEELRAMGVERSDLQVTADPVFTTNGIERAEAFYLLERNGVPTEPFITVSIRDWPNMGSFCESIASVCDHVYDTYGLNTVFISMQPDRDTAISKRVQSTMRNPSYVLESRLTAEELMGIVGASELMLAMRLHALIFAARMCIPFVGLIYDPKVLAYTNKLSMPSAGEVTDFKEADALKAVDMILERRDEYIGILKSKSAELEKAAREDSNYLMKMIKNERKKT